MHLYDLHAPSGSRNQHLKWFFALHAGVFSRILASDWLTSYIPSNVSTLSRKRMAALISKSPGPRVRFRPEADVQSLS